MISKEKIIQVIYAAVEEINKHLPGESGLEKSFDSVIIGKGAKLDSLGLVNFIVELELKITKEFGSVITLANEKAMLQKDNYFKNISTLSLIFFVLNKF